MRNIIITLLLSGLLWNACQKNPTVVPTKKPIEYSFFVAGHAYGHPSDYSLGLYPPFVENFSFLNEYQRMELGFLTGDVVPRPDSMHWDAVENDLGKLTFPVYIAPGNHDRGLEYINRFGDYYYSVKHKGDLFIVLTPVSWNITGTQKSFLENTLNEYVSATGNIFIFLHELIWWSPDSIFGYIEINFRDYYPGTTNYWSEIHPILESRPNEVYVFAGDIGCCSHVSPYMYHQSGNVHLVASGMGNGENDNFIIVEVDTAGEAELLLFGLNYSPPEIMADLKSFTLP